MPIGPPSNTKVLESIDKSLQNIDRALQNIDRNVQGQGGLLHDVLAEVKGVRAEIAKGNEERREDSALVMAEIAEGNRKMGEIAKNTTPRVRPEVLGQIAESMKKGP